MHGIMQLATNKIECLLKYVSYYAQHQTLTPVPMDNI